MGRPRKPLEEHRKDGTRPHGAPADVTPTQLGGRRRPETPTGLDTEARKVWTLVVDDLMAGNVLDHADWSAVEEFAIMVARARQARKALDFERKKAADTRAKAPELWSEYEAQRERFEAGELKYPPKEPDIDMNPMSYLTQGGQKGSRVPSPYLGIERESWREARQIGATLGLSPQARASLGLNAKGGGRKHGAGQGVPESPRAARAAGGLTGIPGGKA